MAAKKPFTFTAVSYVIDKTGDGSVRCRQETVFEQVPAANGAYQFKSIKKAVYMPETEQTECDKKMMRHVGETVSGYLSNLPVKTF